jgi:RimJ/RimL family protein N-acetyltransferase
VVLLRSLRDSDLPAIVEACQDPEIPRWTAVPSPYTEDDARSFLSSTAGDQADGSRLTLAVVDPGGGLLLGSIGLRVNREDAVGQLGYWVAAPARRRGVAARAVTLLSRWAFDALSLARVQLLADTDNPASQRVAERAGFKREGVLRSYREQKGERRSSVLYSLLSTDPLGR